VVVVVVVVSSFSQAVAVIMSIKAPKRTFFMF
jgi:hypothetical protein